MYYLSIFLNTFFVNDFYFRFWKIVFAVKYKIISTILEFLFFKSSIISAHDDSCVILWRIFRDIYFLTRQHTRNIPKIGQDSPLSLFYISLTRVILNLTLFDSRTYIVQWPLKLASPIQIFSDNVKRQSVKVTFVTVCKLHFVQHTAVIMGRFLWFE